jgi:hypothetical protein
LLGFYQASSLGLRGKGLVETSALYFRHMGLPVAPAIEARLVGLLKLRGVEGLAVKPNEKKQQGAGPTGALADRGRSNAASKGAGGRGVADQRSGRGSGGRGGSSRSVPRQ